MSLLLKDKHFKMIIEQDDRVNDYRNTAVAGGSNGLVLAY
jgi:hypothetical protein